MPDTFSYRLNYPAELTRTPKVAVYSYGDGYEQRVGAGLNSNLEKWGVQGDHLPLSTAKAIDSFLITQNASSAFYWKNPYGVTVLVVCRSWKITLNEDEDNVFSATFEEVLG